MPPRRTAHTFLAGPYELVFALFALFHSLVPRLHSDYFSVGPVRFSDKAFTYLLGLQLAFSSGVSSLLPAAVGSALGAVYLVADARGSCARLRCPAGVRACCRRTVLPCLEGESPAAAAARAAAAERTREQAELELALRQIAATGGGGAAGRGGAAPTAEQAAALANALRGAAAQAQAVRAGGGAGGGAGGDGGLRSRSGGGGDGFMPLDHAAVERLVAMGFQRADAERALRECFNDENAAADRLLEG